MSCRFEKAFADVATDIVGGEAPPDWLKQALMQFARTVATTGLREESDPLCKEVRGRFLRLQAAAEKMDRALNGIRDGWLWMMGKDVADLPAVRQAIRKAIEMSDRALDGIPHGGRRRARRMAGPTARVACAIIVIEVWTIVHGKLGGGHNDRVGEICGKYWRACGGPHIGKGSKGGGANNWRRPMKEAFADESALRRYVQTELQAVQNSAKNIGDSVP